MPSTRFTFWVLIVVVAIAGINQGLTIPMLAIMLEEQGVSSLANGLNAAALYIGIFLVSPFLEIPLRKIGYRSTILWGLALVSLATLAIPMFSSLYIWFVLRMLLGIGDSSLHYASQMWVTAIASPERRGRDISLYGLAYGVGFSVGPLGLKLMQWGTWVPFAALCLTYLVSLFFILRIRNAFPDKIDAPKERENKYAAVIRLSWLALLPAFLYGYMETTLNGSFPIYALRIGVSVDWVANILPSFVVGSILLQMPLGSLSDKIGRKRVMMACSIAGACAFLLFPLAGNTVWLMMLLLALAGAAVGSFYSLGLAYSADILPASMVPTAGIISAMNFSIASILAPNANGYVLQYFQPWLIFVIMGALLGSFFIAGFLFRQKGKDQEEQAV